MPKMRVDTYFAGRLASMYIRLKNRHAGCADKQ